MIAPLLVAGTGGFGRETVEVVAAINGVRPTWELVGFLDDDADLHGSEVAAVQVLGAIDMVHERADAKLVVTVGRPDRYHVRQQIVERLALAPDRYATLVHPAAVLAQSTEVGPGTVVLAGCVATAHVSIGSHVVVMPGVTLTHENVVGDYATLASGVRLGGGVTVEPGAYVGAGALVREGRTVGAGALIGMGAVVLDEVPPGEVWVGNPARRLRSGAG